MAAVLYVLSVRSWSKRPVDMRLSDAMPYGKADILYDLMKTLNLLARRWLETEGKGLSLELFALTWVG